MRLTQISYSEHETNGQYWRLHPMDFQQINLVVGRNASGKSRTLNIINGLAQCLSGQRPMLGDGTFNVVFSSGSDRLEYDVTAAGGQILSERYAKNGEELLIRGQGGFGKIYAQGIGSHIEFQTPATMIAAATRNDAVQHPFLMPLISWADRLFYYPCSTDLGKNSVSIIRPDAPPMNPKDANQTAAVMRGGMRNFPGAFETSVIKDMETVGYDLTEVGVMAPITIQASALGLGDIEAVYAREKGIDAPIDQFSMSVGMFRALAIVTHLNYALLSGSAQTILIDDIGEGLDFDRSSNLIRLIADKIRLSDTQIVMTTNDRYVMNGIDLDYWSVLDRKGPEVHAFNSKNRPDDFEEFRFTGLSNFDLLARDFLSTVH